MTTIVLKRSAIAVAIASLLTAGYAHSAWHSGHQSTTGAIEKTSLATSATPNAVSPASTMVLPNFGSIVDRYGAAVVNISVTGTSKTAAAQSPFGDVDPSDPFSQFFRQFRIPAPQGGVPTHGLGSGFIISPDGVILTNAHVVDGANEMIVKLTDKREFKAKVLGEDKLSDIAVIKIDAKDLPVVALGDDKAAHVGDWVLAIGAPFGFENTATAGIISAKSRSLPDEGYVPFLQTDVAVNPGNSGGPLFNLKGEVIGINSQIYSHTGGYQGVSFAVPIDVAVKVKDDILAHGKVTRGRLGVTIQDVSQALAQSFNLTKPEGALISSVDPGGTAAKAGLQPGDVILKLNGEEVKSSTDLPPRIADMKPGDTAKLQIWRDGKSREMTVSIGENHDKELASATAPLEHERLGVAVRPLTPEEKDQANVKGGLLVEQAGGAAARAGIEPGDVILSVNGRAVSTVTELKTLVAHNDKSIALLVQRDNQRIFVPIDLG
ncbi:MAG TPA: DegQ family serine endoprotease [Rhodocyclaceae bacterium]|nr:DegQ family serine endoprotease [Rhodocyclaceae bacterium]